MRTWFVLGLTGLAATPAFAQSAACPATGGPPTSGLPVLRLAAGSTINVPPDLAPDGVMALVHGTSFSGLRDRGFWSVRWMRA